MRIHSVVFSVDKRSKQKQLANHISEYFQLRGNPQLLVHTVKRHSQVLVISTNISFVTMMKDHINVQNVKISNLNTHKIQHISLRPFTCNLCTMAFKTINELNKHKQFHNNNEEKRYVCQICAKDFKSLATLKCHKASHRTVKEYSCTQCAYSCKLKGNLWNHLKNNENSQMSFTYNECQKAFTTRHFSHKSTPQNQGSNAQKYSTVQPDLKFIY